MFTVSAKSPEQKLLTGKRVKLLVDLPPFKKGTICIVRHMLTYRDEVLPEDPFVVECDGKLTNALRREVEILED